MENERTAGGLIFGKWRGGGVAETVRVLYDMAAVPPVKSLTAGVYNVHKS